MLYTDYLLLLYDIHAPKTLRKVVCRLETVNSLRIQKSAFEIQGSKKEIELLLDDLITIINVETDKLALIPLCSEDYDRVEFFGVLSRHPEKPQNYYIL